MKKGLFLYSRQGIIRWLFLFGIGLTLVILGATAILSVSFSEVTAQNYLYLSKHIRYAWNVNLFAIVLMAGGLFLLVHAMHKLIIAVVRILSGNSSDEIFARYFSRLKLGQGPKIVAIGGGKGLSVLLRGLKAYTSNITAVVAVSDDGGSSGRLRQEMGILPPGDIRNCLVALAESETIMEQLFRHRFSSVGELSEHSFGNLFIASLTEVTGDFMTAIRESSRILNICGKVLPVTTEKIVLQAVMNDGSRFSGETNIVNSGKKISKIMLDPKEAQVLPEVIDAIMDADLIVYGPGSLYTSILPNLLLDGVSEALQETMAKRLLVCNIMTQQGETEGFSASDHVKAVIAHAGKIVDCVIINSGAYPEEEITEDNSSVRKPVAPDLKKLKAMHIDYLEDDLLDFEGVGKHDSAKLAATVMGFARSGFRRKSLLRKLYKWI